MKRFAGMCHLFRCYLFRLVFLFLENSVSEFIALVENGYFSLHVLADHHLNFI